MSLLKRSVSAHDSSVVAQASKRADHGGSNGWLTCCRLLGGSWSRTWLLRRRTMTVLFSTLFSSARLLAPAPPTQRLAAANSQHVQATYRRCHTSIDQTSSSEEFGAQQRLPSSAFGCVIHKHLMHALCDRKHRTLLRSDEATRFVGIDRPCVPSQIECC